MSDPIHEARERIAKQAAELAESLPRNVGNEILTANVLKTCAEAVASLAFGPQGGTWDSNIEQGHHYSTDKHGRQAGFR